MLEELEQIGLQIRRLFNGGDLPGDGLADIGAEGRELQQAVAAYGGRGARRHRIRGWSVRRLIPRPDGAYRQRFEPRQL